MRITITKGLSQLNLLDKWIASAIQTGGFVAYYRPGQTLQGATLSADDIKKKTMSSFQSVKDLIARRDKIKAAIVISNAITKVRIGNTDITAAAIEKKFHDSIKSRCIGKHSELSLVEASWLL